MNGFTFLVTSGGAGIAVVIVLSLLLSRRRHLNENVIDPELRQARREFNEQVERGRIRPF